MDLTALILYTISFLDTICFGLIMPVLPVHILILKGSHTILGIHGMLYMILQLFSNTLSRSLKETYGKTFILKTTLFLGIITNVLMGLPISYGVLIFIRMIFYLTNQTQNMVRSCLSDLKDENDNVLNLLGIFGFTLGPVIGGYIFEQSNGFYYLSMLTGLLSFISFVLCNFLPRDSPSKNTKQTNTTLKQKLSENLNSSLKSFSSIDINKNRTILLLRLLISFSLTIFFIKFSLLLKVHYLASHSLVGWTIAYQNIVMFLSTISIPLLDKKVTIKNIYKLRRFLSILAISATAVCFSPTYEIYLISFIPLGLAKSFVESAWKEIEKAQEKDSHLPDVLKTVTTITSVFAPVILGIFCDIYLHNAVKALVVIPLVVASFLGSYYYVSPAKSPNDKTK